MGTGYGVGRSMGPVIIGIIRRAGPVRGSGSRCPQAQCQVSQNRVGPAAGSLGRAVVPWKPWSAPPCAALFPRSSAAPRRRRL